MIVQDFSMNNQMPFHRIIFLAVGESERQGQAISQFE
ncbi:hypothetical protein J2Y45_004697 [Dyadobacter sp. BE34]|uniref:Uncharacterized protein n=1 Tax=Dyadobacter fermentans TaxID=94254 RepID=A0ABU1R2P3_9BACT|nr:hypothetical protein [Dyadobacter fermentans]MDR7045238.1 hypothetical protein [Dyadobacter sp. BE242]MDR7199551.1 hypothetical protein [Dyadobacter sp. BE34]MDR7217990.1 hypothetical protein [Dyadobacter sp. BE31]MDR7265442.1 hypothetical protein [Dyadobacter sp. BE32]